MLSGGEKTMILEKNVLLKKRVHSFWTFPALQGPGPGPYGPIRDNMGPYGPLWAHMDPKNPPKYVTKIALLGAFKGFCTLP